MDNVVTGWPLCLHMVAAVATLFKDADKLTLGKPLTIIAPHALETLIHQPPDRWFSNAHITYYHSLLLTPKVITLGNVTLLNPSTFLPNSEPTIWVPHECHQILDEYHSTRGDLTDCRLPDAGYTWLIYDSSFLKEGERKVGAAVVD